MPEKNTKFDTRLDQRNHKRKKNNILNILIGIVILLIIVVTVNIITGDDEKESAEQPTSSLEEENKDNESIEQEQDVESTEESDTSTDSTESSSDEETNTNTNTEPEIEEETESTETEGNEADTVTSEPSNGTNIDSVISDSEWQPIGTEQTGEHVSSYDSTSVDWNEKVKALAYAANLDSSNMYVKFIGNGGSPQKSVGTVTSKDGSEIYRISLEWVDGEGWKPTKKEKLKTLE